MEPEPNEPLSQVTEVDGNVLRDLESKYSTIACPVHNTPPSFEVASDGSVVEHLCCEVLLRIFRELQAKEEQEGE